jgi:hypothetical protein
MVTSGKVPGAEGFGIKVMKKTVAQVVVEGKPAQEERI